MQVEKEELLLLFSCFYLFKQVCLDTLERAVQEQAGRDVAVFQKLKSELKRSQARLRKCEQDIRTSEETRQAIYNELGSSLLSSHMEAIQEASHTVIQKELELDQARQKRDECSAE